jgi:MFS family permease
MMADNIEHVISYWLMFQKFHSPALGGFAVVAHWVPFLAFSLPVGALNDRFDSRRLIQIGGALFCFVSLAWGYLFLSDTLEMWHAMVLLVLHGCAGVFWSTSSRHAHARPDARHFFERLLLPAIAALARARSLWASFSGSGSGAR